MFKRFLSFLSLALPITGFTATIPDLSKVNQLPQPGTIALTFDDGPNPIYTRQILAILKKYNIKATFFVVGVNAQKYPDVIKEIYAQGHVIGNHTMTHPMLTKVPEQQLNYEIVNTSNIISSIIGIKPKCLRLPFGAANSHVRDEIRAAGMIPIGLGFNSFDFERPGTENIVNWTLSNIFARQVLLLHDGYDQRQQTVDALPQIIEGIKKKGLGFSTICG